MLTAVWENPAASAFALLGATCLISWPLCSTRRGMLLVQIGIGIGLHYALWGSATAALVNGLGAVQAAAALIFGTNPRTAVAWIWPYSGARRGVHADLEWSSIHSGSCRSDPHCPRTVENQSLAMRGLVLSGLLFWLAHDGIMGSPLLFADLLCLTIGVVALVSRRGTLVWAKLPQNPRPDSAHPA
jgi:hypothetical protein